MRHENGSLHGNLALQLDPEFLNSLLTDGSAALPRRLEQPLAAPRTAPLSAPHTAPRTAHRTAPRTAPGAEPRPTPRRVGDRSAGTAVSMEGERKRQIRRELTLQRLRALLLVVTVVILVSGLFGIMVWRQARILEQNFSNLSIERQIKKLDENSSQIKEHLAVRTELSQIRTSAIQRLGLQVPARSQIVPVVIPQTDRVIFNDRVQSSPGDESYLMGLLFNVEGFFKTLDVKGK